MFEFIRVDRAVCDGCGVGKTVGIFNIYEDKPYVWLCSVCLDNASRQIANKADKLYFDWDAGKFINLYKEDIQAWEWLYPNIDVIWFIETAMPQWLMSAKGRKKSKKSDWNRFANNWLQREQLKAIGVM